MLHISGWCLRCSKPRAFPGLCLGGRAGSESSGTFAASAIETDYARRFLYWRAALPNASAMSFRSFFGVSTSIEDPKLISDQRNDIVSCTVAVKLAPFSSLSGAMR